MFHTLSKALGALVSPANALVVLALLGLFLTLFPPLRLAGRIMAWTAAVLFAVLAILPVGDWLLRPLETRFTPFQPDGRPVAGVIVLGGSFGDGVAPWRATAQPNGAPGRIFETARLARLYPQAPVVISGGPIDPKTGVSEADLVVASLADLGVARERMKLERASHDTFENARFSRDLLHPTPDQRWLLVTSAFHVPRAVAAFRHAGFNVRPAPCDWRSFRRSGPASWSVGGNLIRTDLAVREYLGLLTYRLSGRTAEMLPGRSAKETGPW